MNEPTRREFLKQLAATSLFALVGRNSATTIVHNERAFELLIIGDSLIWGQGLEEADKFYSLTADWLANDVFGQLRQVNLTVKAHSGATIRFDAKEAEKYRAAGRDETSYYHGEVNVSTPSMWKQVESASMEYKSRGCNRGADLVMLSAGITDIAVEGVLNPFDNPKKLSPLIEEVCRKRVGDLIAHIAESNPQAKIVLIGYYPILSPRSSRSAVFNGWLETLNIPNWLQGIANNRVMRPLLFGRLFKRALMRSRIWAQDSDRQLNIAVAEHNTKVGWNQAIFIPSNLTEENAVETPNTLLFRMRKDGTVEDPLFSRRKADCAAAFDDLWRVTRIENSLKRCTVAAVGHPNPTGSRFYFEVIKSTMKAHLDLLRR